MHESNLILAHLVATLLMVGIIWFVQIVHYPLLARVGREQFPEYIKLHQSLTTYVVAAPMLVEAISLAVLIIYFPTSPTSHLLVSSSILLLIVWLSTTFWQVPIHQALMRGYDEKRIQQLVRSNWLRTWAWTLRCAFVCIWWSETYLLA